MSDIIIHVAIVRLHEHIIIASKLWLKGSSHAPKIHTPKTDDVIKLKCTIEILQLFATFKKQSPNNCTWA